MNLYRVNINIYSDIKFSMISKNTDTLSKEIIDLILDYGYYLMPNYSTYIIDLDYKKNHDLLNGVIAYVRQYNRNKILDEFI
jgi:hypothetical protein